MQDDNEVANFALNSNKIYKLTLENSDGNYNYYYSKKPVKAINGKLYATSDAIENAFNVSFSYDTEKPRLLPGHFYACSCSEPFNRSDSFINSSNERVSPRTDGLSPNFSRA